MKFTRLATIALVSVTLGAGGLMAQTVAGSEPAEFPPASYKGKQYVDSNGCVFIRAGIDGTVSWVPRLTRTRTGVCGFKPTFAGQVSAPSPVQTAASQQITIAAPAATPAPVARPRVQPAAAPKPKPKVVRQVAKRPVPIVEKPVQPAPVYRTAGIPQGVTACPDASPLSQQYLRRGKYDVRCGPQAQPIVGAGIIAGAPSRVATGNAASSSGPIAVSSNRRIVPRHVAVNRVNTNNVMVPKGYKRVWTDGRLNPKRAEQSVAGHRDMTLIWTSTVPRRLINQADGRDVTATVPLVYPYTDYETQQARLGQVTIVKRQGQTLKRIVRNVGGVFTPKPRQAKVQTVARTPIFSSRSAPKAAPKIPAAHTQPGAEVAGRGYVQAGAFTSAEAAQRHALKIKRLGLPVRVGLYTRDGQTQRLVIAGPFNGDAGVTRAVKQLRSAGFNATPR